MFIAFEIGNEYILFFFDGSMFNAFEIGNEYIDDYFKKLRTSIPKTDDDNNICLNIWRTRNKIQTKVNFQFIRIILGFLH